MLFYLSLYSVFHVISDSCLNFSGDGVSTAITARRPVFSACGLRCSRFCMRTSGLEQLGLVPGARVACIGKMRLIWCRLWSGICTSVAVAFCTAVKCLMSVQFLAWISVKSGLACISLCYRIDVVPGKLCPHGDGLTRGSRVRYERPISSVGKREDRTDLPGELLYVGSPVRDPIGSVSFVGCFVDGLVRAGHPRLSVDESAERSF